MKNKVLYPCLLLALLASCSKKNSGSGSASNTWNFKGTNYSAATVVYVNGGGAADLSATASGATSTSANGLIFSFTTPPTGNTQMLITDSNDPNTVLVSTSNLTGTTTTFYSNSATTVTAIVSITNGKVSANFPGTIWLHNESNFNDSAQLSAGTITEQ